jgi:hypothetical protein
MNRRERRRARAMMGVVDDAIERIMTTDGDCCSLCRAPFSHNSRTFGGVTGGGVIALVGECCASRLELQRVAGLYTTRPYVEPSEPGNGARELSSEQIEQAITAHQQYFAAVDAVVDRAARRAGMPHMAERTLLHCEDTAWKDADRKWFEAHPTRSHRLRQLFAGEFETCTAPPGHELQILVRQVEPGLRIRNGFYRNLAIEIPDIEPVLHALFDLMSEREERVVSVEEVAALASKYADSGEAAS